MVQLPTDVTRFMDEFRKAGYKIYVVGGCMRDLLLGLPVPDWDFTTDAKPEQIQELFPDSFYNNSFGTVGVKGKIENTDVIFEVTTFRKEEAYSDHRRPSEVAWSDSLEDDLQRRDFTVNAIAYDGTTIVDPFEGRQDLEQRIICAVGDPDKRFQEDALRLLRAIRFAVKLNFEIEHKTKESIKRNIQLIRHISWERIQQEFFRILGCDRAADGILLMREVGLLSIILPELDACFAIDQKSPNRHHKDDVGTHLVKALKYCPSKDIITRFATLIHDIGKVKTYRKDMVSGQVTFYNHEVVGKIQAEKIADRFKLSKADKDTLVRLVEHHQFTVSEDQSDKAIRRFIRDVGIENIQKMLDLRTGDRLGSGAKESSWRLELFKKRIIEVQYEPFSVKDLKVDGHDVMKIFQIKPSRQIGDILDEVFALVDDKKLPNEREALLQYLQEKTRS